MNSSALADAICRRIIAWLESISSALGGSRRSLWDDFQEVVVRDGGIADEMIRDAVEGRVRCELAELPQAGRHLLWWSTATGRRQLDGLVRSLRRGEPSELRAPWGAEEELSDDLERYVWDLLWQMAEEASSESEADDASSVDDEDEDEDEGEYEDSEEEEVDDDLDAGDDEDGLAEGAGASDGEEGEPREHTREDQSP